MQKFGRKKNQKERMKELLRLCIKERTSASGFGFGSLIPQKNIKTVMAKKPKHFSPAAVLCDVEVKFVEVIHTHFMSPHEKYYLHNFLPELE